MKRGKCTSSLAVLLFPLLAACGQAAAPPAVKPSACAICLGGPTRDTTIPALGPWRRDGAVLRLHGLPELLFIGTLWDAYSGYERWPVTKALEQFGSLSGVVPETHDAVLFGRTRAVSTFNWRNSRYQSPYLVFVDREIQGYHAGALARLTGRELGLYHRYVGPGPPHGTRNSNFLAVVTKVPLVALGGYVATTQNMDPGELGTFPPSAANVEDLVPFPFSTVQRALARGCARGCPQYVHDINAQVNVITALICHVDGRRPASTCDRPVIRALLRHVR